MAEPKDPLAEHPLGPDATPRSPSRKASSLSLFPEPDLGEVPLGGPPAAPTAPTAPAKEPRPAPSAPSSATSPAAAVPRDPEPLLFHETAAGPDTASGSPGDDVAFGTPEPEEGELGVGFARRVVAGLADLLILGLFGAVELAAGAFFLNLRFPPPALLPLGAFLFLAALVLMVLAPFVWGTTPGMALVDVKVVAGDGGSPTLLSAFLRFLGFLLTGALAGIPLLVVAFDRKRRTLADLVSGTTLEPAR